MFKKMYMILIIGICLAGFIGAEEMKAERVNNKICPVTGEAVDMKNPVTYEYKGKIYNLCCPMCIGEFKKDPEKYVAKVKEEKKEEGDLTHEHSAHESH